MTCLTVVITHLDAPAVEAQMSYLQAVCPDSRFLVCHGGQRSEFERLSSGPAIFVDDPTLRAPFIDRSHNSVLTGVFESHVRDDATVDLVYFIEYDHLVLGGDFEGQLIAASERSGADFIGKNCIERNDTNWWHHLRWKSDPAINRYFAEISRRRDTHRRFGCLGSGMLVTREALEAFAALPPPPRCYVELFVPSAIYHLGFEVDDFDRLGDLYLTVRWRPEYSRDEAVRAKRTGHCFVHPFKDLAALDEIRLAPSAP